MVVSLLKEVDHYSKVSDALALVEKDGQTYLYHKSGFRIVEDPVQSAEVLGNGWIKLRRNDRWALYSMLGFPITEWLYDDIYQLGPFWVFDQKGQLAVCRTNDIRSQLPHGKLLLDFKFEDLELINEELLMGFSQEKECLLDNDLNVLIPWGEYEIYPDENGWYLRSEKGYYLYDSNEGQIGETSYPYLESNNGWLALKTEEDWILIPRAGQMEPSRSYDSIKLINEHAALTFSSGNKKVLHFNNGEEITLKEHEILSFQRRPEFLLIKNKGALGL